MCFVSVHSVLKVCYIPSFEIGLNKAKYGNNWVLLLAAKENN